MNQNMFLNSLFFLLLLTLLTYLFNLDMKKQLREWFIALFHAGISVLIINWLFFYLSQVPTGSMEPSIIPGDVLFISTMHYGARTPRTPLRIPFLGSRIPGTNIPSYLSFVKLPIYRLPGFSKVKRGDCVVFSPPQSFRYPDTPDDVRIPYIKECVGLSGDRLAIRDGEVYVNGTLYKPHKDWQHCYYIKTNYILPEKFFKKYSIRNYRLLAEEGTYNIYNIYTTETTAEEISRLPAIDLIMPIIKEVGDPTAAFFASSVGGNEDQLPEFTIPYKGMQIVINKKTLRFYAKTIHDYEGNKKVVFNLSQGKLWIDDILTETYVFKKSYLFMLGRNLSLSDDSRYFGVIPLENVIGKALCILINGKNPDVHLLYNLLTGNIDSSRFFRKL